MKESKGEDGDKNIKTTLPDGKELTHKDFLNKFKEFLNQRIAGETLVPADMERFMRRTSGKSLEQLMRSKKLEGYMEGSSDKMFSRGQIIALGTIVTIIFVGIILIVMLRSLGILPE